MNLWDCQAFRVYEMIILLRPYNTLYGIYYAAWRQGACALAGVYNERARARCIYHANTLWVHDHYTLGARARWFGAKFTRAF